MEQGQKETFITRVVSVCFTVVVLAIFKPFGLGEWQWMAYGHLLAIGALGVAICMLTEFILKYVAKKPRSLDRGVGYIIRRNLWFQLINTPLVALMICLYRHFFLSDMVASNQLSWSNFLETLLIIAFCSFMIGLYWRFKFRNRYLAAELEETRQLNEQLQQLQHAAENRAQMVQDAEQEPEASTKAIELPDTIKLSGNTSESVLLQIGNLLYVESVGNYVKVCWLHEGKMRTDMLRATSKQVEEELKLYPMIVRCHRAFLVNLHQVEKILSQSGTMQLVIKQSGDHLPVSRSNMAHIKKAIKGSREDE